MHVLQHLGRRNRKPRFGPSAAAREEGAAPDHLSENSNVEAHLN
jgi:hypothetical protein